MPLEINTLELVPVDCFANLGRGLSEFGLLIGEEPLFGAGRALGAVEPFKAAAEAGMAESAIAVAIARQLVEDVSDLRGLLVDMDLPGEAEVVSGEAGSGENRRQGAYM